jgi:hypothetical protein
MAQLKRLAVDKLTLDPQNYRTVPQRNETGAVHALLSLKPEWFWALCGSLVEDGYRPNEAIIVLEDGNKLTIKEGNRRIAALKLILGQIQLRDIDIPADLKAKIAKLDATWKSENSEVPCAIYPAAKAELVDRIVDQIHGKGEQAGRLDWPSVARARHNRANGGNEPGLDLLEKYLKKGKNLNREQAERWGGDYKVTVLDEVLKRIATRVDATSARDVIDQYPDKTKYRDALETIMADIGLQVLTFPKVRDDAKDFGETYNLPKPLSPSPTSQAGSVGTSPATSTPPGQPESQPGQGAASSTAAPGQAATTNASTTAQPKKTAAAASNDATNVKRLLKNLRPVGQNRSKVVVLLNEAKKLKLETHPHAFCFVLRAMFELSGKAYCADHAKDGLSATKPDGRDKDLAVMLREITQHLIGVAGGPMTPVGRRLHGAMTQLDAQSQNPLSITSLNQLIHNGVFVVDETHIATLFGNVYPLLEAMNH